LAFYFMDVGWYHRLLIGSVQHALKLEDELEGYIPGIGLSRRIAQQSPIPFRRLNGLLKRVGLRPQNAQPLMMHSTHKIHTFYGVIAVLLVLFAILVQLSVESSSGPISPMEAPPSPTGT
jgi:hypothetical protein